jgi:hypothetical protein
MGKIYGGQRCCGVGCMTGVEHIATLRVLRARAKTDCYVDRRKCASNFTEVTVF